MVIPRVVLYSKNMFSMSGLLIKKAALKSVEFENTYLEDWRMLVKLSKKGIRGRLVLCPRIFYRSRENSITPKKKSIQVNRIFHAMREMHGPLLPILLFPSYFFFGLIKILVEMAPGKSMSFRGGDAD